MEASEAEIKLKLLILGDSMVGKTSLMLRYLRDTFVHSHISTMGLDVQRKTLSLESDRIELQIVNSTQWDTAGQERYRAIHSQYFRQVNGVMMVYDCSSEESFLHIEYWLGVVTANVADKLPVVLIGNKSDLNDKAVASDRAQAFAQQGGIALFETSALLNTNVEAAFLHIAKLMLGQFRAQPASVACHKSVKLRNSARFLRNQQKKCLCNSSRRKSL